MTVNLRSLPATQKVYKGFEVTGATVRVKVNQEKTKVVSQTRIGKDIPNGMRQSKFESVEEYKYLESLSLH
jgi:hypothetical protein